MKLIRPFHPLLTVLDILGLAGIAICLNEVSPGKKPFGWVPQHLVWPLFTASLVVVLACTVHQIRAVISKRSSPGAGSVNQTHHAARVSAAAKPMPKWLKWGLLGCAAVFALVVSSKIADRIRLANSEPYKDAKSLIDKSPELSASMGTPLELEFPVGYVSATESAGIAALDFGVSGPLGKGQARARAIKTARTGHRWKLTRLVVYDEKSKRGTVLIQESRQ